MKMAVGIDKLPLSKNPAFITIKYKIITGVRENSNILWIPSEKQLYIKNSKTAKSGIHYVCNSSTCRVRVYVKDNLCYKLKNSKLQHKHPTCESKYEELLALKEIRSKVISDKKTKLKKIFDEVMKRHKGVALKYADHVRTFQKLRNKSPTIDTVSVSSIKNNDTEENEPGATSTVTRLTEKKPTISTHILDTSRGQAAANVPVTLYVAIDDKNSNNWREISSSSTNNDGRCADLTTDENYQGGYYKLRFDTEKYFQNTSPTIFYPFVEIVFHCLAGQHYHIPLLLQPFGYTTYRGT